MGRKSREKRERRAAAPPPVGKHQPGRWRSQRWVLALAAVALAAAVVIAAVVSVAKSGRGAVKLSAAPVAENSLPGIETGPPPWPAEHRNLASRLDQLGLPRLQMEADAFHIHQHLDLFVDGRHLTVPALIGIDVQQRYLDPLHTHDTSGIIHVESPTKTNYTLGRFFAVWGLRLTRSCIGGLCSSGTKQLRAYVNGTRVNANPARIVLTAHEEIVLAYGTPSEQPRKIPSSYPFPIGL